jgi:hypothetical protein
VSAESIKRRRDEILDTLRRDRPLGPKASGLFGTAVRSAGEIKVLSGSEILLALPSGAFSQVVPGVDQVVERVLCSVLGKSVRARFVDKARLAEYKPSQPGPAAAPEAQQGTDTAQETSAPSSPTDPYEEAKLDPVVQDLVRRGGQVTDVELSE